ncbi:MAG: hypothetical protein AAFN92_18445 [Bacteroidota bacterium]
MHGNDLNDPSDQHLYVIYDREERRIHKFGISNKKVGADGHCRRMRNQVNAGNRWSKIGRYVARILVKLIKGRRRARALEDDCIIKYRDKYGAYPRGNEDHQFLSEVERKKL